MSCSRALVFALVVAPTVVAGCARGGQTGVAVPVRAACAVDARWDGRACVARHAAESLAASDAAMKLPDLDAAQAGLDRAAAEPLDLAAHVALWERRGTIASYLAADQPTPAREEAARAAFDRLLAIAPDHHVACEAGDKVALRFERTRAALSGRAPRELEITWPRDSRLGAAVPVDLETVADPTGVLASVTLYLRARGAATWRAADVALPPPGQRQRIRLPGVAGHASTGLELYAVAHDRDGNDTLAWASAEHPRDIPLRFDPPTPWYRTWWVWAIAGGVAATGAGVTAYALTWSPSPRVGGTVTP